MNKDNQTQPQNQALLTFLREQSKTVYGLHFSSSGLLLLGKRYQVSAQELDAAIQLIRQEAAVKL